jgi:hypothetical protein
MSTGNNIDDSDFERAEALYETAVQMEVNGLPEEEAIKVAGQVVAKRAEAEKSGQVVSDEQGNAVSYHDSALNPEPVPASQREAVNHTYQKLCENEGVEAL